MTIKKNYNKISDIPNSVYYEEYNDKDKKWYSGDLKLTKYELIYSDSTTKIYQATFTGTIKRNIQINKIGLENFITYLMYGTNSNKEIGKYVF